MIDLMKKIFFLLFFFLSLSVKADGVWTPAAQGGGGGGTSICYTVQFNAGMYGNNYVASASGSIYKNEIENEILFSGVLWKPSLNRYSVEYFATCKSQGWQSLGECVGYQVNRYDNNSITKGHYITSVSNLPIKAATPFYC